MNCNVTGLVTPGHRKLHLVACGRQEVCHSKVSNLWDQREIIGPGGQKEYYYFFLVCDLKKILILIVVIDKAAEKGVVKM